MPVSLASLYLLWVLTFQGILHPWQKRPAQSGGPGLRTACCPSSLSRHPLLPYAPHKIPLAKLSGKPLPLSEGSSQACRLRSISPGEWWQKGTAEGRALPTGGSSRPRRGPHSPPDSQTSCGAGMPQGKTGFTQTLLSQTPSHHRACLHACPPQHLSSPGPQVTEASSSSLLRLSHGNSWGKAQAQPFRSSLLTINRCCFRFLKTPWD